MSGAVDFDECPGRGSRKGCRCGVCGVCGYTKHSGAHGPINGRPPGSEPWGHEFVARDIDGTLCFQTRLIEVRRDEYSALLKERDELIEMGARQVSDIEGYKRDLEKAQRQLVSTQRIAEREGKKVEELERLLAKRKEPHWEML